jgi:hypothetical protein
MTGILKAGREMDKLVAQKVLGTELCGCGNPECDLTGEGEYEPVPPYSTDIALAWRVLEQFPSEKLVEDWWGAPAANRWGCIIAPRALDRRAEGYGATAPEAICRAALAAVRTSG